MEVPLGDTYYFLFTTRQFSDGAPTTLSGTPVLSVYEENNATQITSGVAVSADYDGVTGLNECSIVATSGNGYEAGKYYSVVITTGTVGGTSVVGEVVGHFRIMVAESFSSGIKDTNIYSVSGDATAANNLESDYDGTGYTKTNSTVGTVSTLTGHTPQTGDSYARLGAPAGASVSADIADIPTVSEFEARTLPSADYFDPSADTVATVTSVTNQVTANVTAISGDTTAADNLEESCTAIVFTTVNDASATTTSFVITSAEDTNDHYKGRVIIFTTGNLANQATDITAYNGTTKAVTVTALTEAPGNGDAFVIV